MVRTLGVKRRKLKNRRLEEPSLVENLQILNSDDYANYLKKQDCDPADYIPDIIHLTMDIKHQAFEWGQLVVFGASICIPRPIARGDYILQRWFGAVMVAGIDLWTPAVLEEERMLPCSIVGKNGYKIQRSSLIETNKQGLVLLWTDMGRAIQLQSI
ncbi:hypothetical protein ZIOFF_067834 [Zingiber officinale]|uniref:Uncharacterized protein n=1 Tax=Zingiber officinale TaxID=94328 RepID=A0A8J5EEA0_ZINOF|nr:hypothetical protein ZIOFF_067834 [Zingiber officinale]